MWRLDITIDVHGTRGEHSTSNRTVSAKLLLNSVADYSEYVEQSGGTLKPPAKTPFGRWQSSSIYLGKEQSGKYYVTRLLLPDIESGTIYDSRVKNPVGLFFDSTSDDEPFLILYDFYPADMSHRMAGGFGLLDRAAVPTSNGVHWLPKTEDVALLER